MRHLRENGDIVAVTIVPEQGNLTIIAQHLLLLAAHPSEVQYVSRPQPGFLISDELYDRFVEFTNRTEVAPTEEETPTIVAVPRRGRPKKNVEGQ
jgi:hypothetical protein